MIPYAFTYESKLIQNNIGESALLRVDSSLSIKSSKNYAGMDCGCINDVEIHEIKNLDNGEDLTNHSTELVAEANEQIIKAEQYLIFRESLSD
jgi:hypothetical protein